LASGFWAFQTVDLSFRFFSSGALPKLLLNLSRAWFPSFFLCRFWHFDANFMTESFFSINVALLLSSPNLIL